MSLANLITVGPTGVSFPSDPVFLEAFKDEYRLIYGADIYLEADSQDGQWIAVMALAMYDAMTISSAVYSSFSPLTAQSDALSRNVRINGISRDVATNSTVDLTLVGTTGTVITGGAATDASGNIWLLPTPTTITVGTGTTVTATCSVVGSIQASASSITQIATPTLGWTSVNNTSAATGGSPVESDADLRDRQTRSTALPSQSIFDGIIGAVESVTGVTETFASENDTGVTFPAPPTSTGQPGHSIALVVLGGTDAAIAAAIAETKTAGTTTYAINPQANIIVFDKYGIPNTINFGRPSNVTIKVAVTIEKIAFYVATTDTLIKDSVAAYVTALGIGDDVLLNRLFTPANLESVPEGATYVVRSIWATSTGVVPIITDNVDLILAFNTFTVCAQSDVTLIVI